MRAFRLATMTATVAFAATTYAQEATPTPVYTAYPMVVCAAPPPEGAQCTPLTNTPAPWGAQNPYAMPYGYPPPTYAPYPYMQAPPAPYGYGYPPPSYYPPPQGAPSVQVQLDPPTPVVASAEGQPADAPDATIPGDESGEEVVGGSATTQLRRSLRQSAATIHFRGLSPDGTNDMEYAGIGLGFRRDLDPNWTLSLTTDAMFSRQDGTEFAAIPIAASALAHFFPMSRVDPFVGAGAGVGFRATPFGDRADEFAQMLLYYGAGLDIRVWNIQLIVQARQLEVTSEIDRADGTAFGLRSGMEGSFALGGVW